MTKIEKLILAGLFGILCLFSPRFAWSQAGGGFRDMRICDKRMRVSDNTPMSVTIAKQLFSVSSSSGSAVPQRAWGCIYNMDATAANHVWYSTFQVTALVGGVLDTSRSFPIPGGNTDGSRFCLPIGANIPIWVHRVIGTANVAALACE